MRIIGAALLAVTLLAQPGVNSYSLEKERALGEALASDVRRQSAPFHNPAAEAHLNRIAGRLVSRIGQPPVPFTFELILTAAGTEPMAFPGGPVLVPAAFFLAAADEAEFAGMLAHCIGHIALRRPFPLATGIPLLLSHAESRPTSSILLPIGALPAQRQQELEADQFGVNLAASAGFVPNGLRRYLERMQGEDAKWSPLPERGLRLARLDEILATLPAGEPESSTQFDEARDAVREAIGLPPPHRPPTLRRK